MNKKLVIGLITTGIILGGATIVGASMNDGKEQPISPMKAEMNLEEGNLLTSSEAKEIALKKKEGRVNEIELEKENGITFYEIEIENDGIEYEIYIDAYTGEVLKVESEYVMQKKKENKVTKFITEEEAKKIAEEKVTGTVTEIIFDEDDGRYEYEVELKTEKGEAELTINAVTGEVIEIEKEINETKRNIEKPNNNNEKSNLISLEEAKKIAVNKVGGKVVEIELDEDDGRYEYEVELKIKNGEAEVTVDAVTGKVLEVEIDKYKSNNKKSKNNNQKSNFISLGEAKKIAVNKVGGKVVEIELDEDDGRYEYEVELITNRGEAELSIDAITGKILEIEIDDDDDYDKKTIGNLISIEEAKKIAVNKIGGKVIEIELDEDDGRYEYEVELITNRGEVEVTIDAVTGKILEIERD